jgi:hypothetical protein
MNQPPDFAPLHERWGPFVKNVSEIAPDIWLADAARGTKGTGKVWYPCLIGRSRKAGQPSWQNGPPISPFEEIGCIKTVGSGYRRGQCVVRMFNRGSDPATGLYCYTEALFAKFNDALDFLKRNAESHNALS